MTILTQWGKVPALKIDKLLHPAGDVSSRGRLERRIVFALINHMADNGFKICAVHDYETETSVKTAKDAMELVFNLDNCNLHFTDAQGKTHCMCLVLGNGTDCISDWFISSPAFDNAMRLFNSEDYA